MLELKNIKKSYKIGDIETKALDDVSVCFREKEFVSILGPSGSGKSTCLNIIGGLDRYDSGDLIIKGKKTKDFKDKDWDAYRNNSIGFVFQNYNLISHLSIVDNVEMGMTLSGVKGKEKKKRAIEVLEKVGLKEHIHKRPNQLSGGQMQRVAIARAIVNDPEILLCDEPTGALDTVTSVQIMEIIKEISKDKLVIMVTHNPDLAEKYSDRIIKFEDGKILSDSNPYDGEKQNQEFKLKKTSMNFLTALHLSFNNIRTKKGRTFLTAFASSIGIIGIAVILSLSTGFQTKIDGYVKDTMDQFPIIINQSSMQLDEEQMENSHDEMSDMVKGTREYADSDEMYLYDTNLTSKMHVNVLSEEYMEYLGKIDKDVCSSIGYISLTNLNLLRRNTDNEIINVKVAGGVNQSASFDSRGMSSINATTYPKMLDENRDYLKEYYDILEGEYPKEPTDVVLVVDYKNRIAIDTVKDLGFETENVDSIKFRDIVGLELKLIDNNDYYVKTGYGTYTFNTDYDSMFNSPNSITLNVVGVVRAKENVKISLLSDGIAYSSDLNKLVEERAINSDIVKDQNQVNYNILTKQDFTSETEKSQTISYLGGSDIPLFAILYPTSFDNKDKLCEYLDKWNEGKSDDDKIIYQDLSETITEMTSGIMDGITIVLIAFAAISLVVSLIMICIITYTSVLERTKEIGILKALGARKKDITRVFNAETFILGIFSGTLGIIIAYLLTIPINQVIYKLADLENVANLQITHAVILIVISTFITMLGGYIPAKIAAKKDAVDALRTE